MSLTSSVPCIPTLLQVTVDPSPWRLSPGPPPKKAVLKVQNIALASKNATLTARNSAFQSARDSMVRTMYIGTKRMFSLYFIRIFLWIIFQILSGFLLFFI